MNFLNYTTNYVVNITKKEEKFCPFRGSDKTLTFAVSEFALTSPDILRDINFSLNMKEGKR